MAGAEEVVRAGLKLLESEEPAGELLGGRLPGRGGHLAIETGTTFVPQENTRNLQNNTFSLGKPVFRQFSL